MKREALRLPGVEGNEVVRFTSKQCFLPFTYPGELFAVTSNFLPPKKTMSSHLATFFFFPFKLKCL